MIEKQLNFLQPTLQKWDDPVFNKAGLQVDILRLDKMHPQLGGNKWMKLWGFLKTALAERKKGVLTKGGPWSNHIHACAWACKELGMPLQVWIKGHEKLQTAMLADIKKWDAEVKFINRNQFYNEEAALHFAIENNLLYIPMGGADEPGIVESSRFLQELHLPKYNYAACAVGTATTFGGLAFMPQNFETVIGIDAGTNDETIAAKIESWQQKLPHKKLMHNSDFTFGGFAKWQLSLAEFANRLYQQQGIPTDIIYTAKLFFAVQQLALKGFFEMNSSIMVLHSGGLQGNRSLPPKTLQF